MIQLPFPISKRRRVWPALAVFAVLVLSTAAALVSPPASAADPYRVGGIQVSGEAKSAAAAKRRAVASGMPGALRLLLRRVTAPDDYKRLAAIRWQGIDQLVTGYEVESERATETAYRGVIAYRFDRAMVRRWLRGQKVAVIDTAARPTLILPVWRARRGPLLWDDPNPWRAAWSALDRRGGLVPIVTGDGDLADLQAIDGSQAAAGSRAALAAIAERYKAGAVVVAVAEPAGEDVRITVRRYVMPAGAVQDLGSVSAKRDAASMARAAKGIAARLDATWKRSNQIDTSRTATLRVVAPLDGLAYWTKLRAQLGGVALVRRYQVVRFGTDRSILDLVHAGSVEQLRGALQEAGLDLRRAPRGDRWVLRLATGPRSPGAPGAPTDTPGRRTDDRRP